MIRMIGRVERDDVHVIHGMIYDSQDTGMYSVHEVNNDNTYLR